MQKDLEGPHSPEGQMVVTFCHLSSVSDKCGQSLQQYMVGYILTTVSSPQGPGTAAAWLP